MPAVDSSVSHEVQILMEALDRWVPDQHRDGCYDSLFHIADKVREERLRAVDAETRLARILQLEDDGA